MAYTYEQVRAFVVECVTCGCCEIDDNVVDLVTEYIRLNYEAAETKLDIMSPDAAHAKIVEANVYQLYAFGTFVAGGSTT